MEIALSLSLSLSLTHTHTHTSKLVHARLHGFSFKNIDSTNSATNQFTFSGELLTRDRMHYYHTYLYHNIYANELSCPQLPASVLPPSHLKRINNTIPLEQMSWSKLDMISVRGRDYYWEISQLGTVPAC